MDLIKLKETLYSKKAWGRKELLNLGIATDKPNMGTEYVLRLVISGVCNDEAFNNLAKFHSNLLEHVNTVLTPGFTSDYALESLKNFWNSACSDGLYDNVTNLERRVINMCVNLVKHSLPNTKYYGRRKFAKEINNSFIFVLNAVKKGDINDK